MTVFRLEAYLGRHAQGIALALLDERIDLTIRAIDDGGTTRTQQKKGTTQKDQPFVHEWDLDRGYATLSRDSTPRTNVPYILKQHTRITPTVLILARFDN